MPGSATQNAKRPLILGIDDQTLIHELLNAVLHNAGFNYKSATSGEQGLQLLSEDTPAAILLDVDMPGQLNGFETCLMIRKKLKLTKVPVIFFTARKTMKDVKAALEVGGDDFMVKPFTPDKVVQHIRHVIEKKKAEVGA